MQEISVMAEASKGGAPSREKVHQQEERKLACLERGKAQECNEKRKLRRVEEGAACPIEGKAQQAYKRALVEEHYSKGVPKEARLFDLS